MMRCLAAMLMLSAMAVGAAAQDGLEPDKLPRFTAGDHKLHLTQWDVSSRADLADDTRSKHALSFDGFVTPAAGTDAVAVSRDLRALRMYDGKGNELMVAAPRGRATRERPPEDFNAVQDDRGETSLSKTALVGVPWSLRSMDTQALLIVAKVRQEHRVPAVVMEDFTDVGGVELRIDRLNMSADRKLSVSMQYRRGGGGPSGPFVEAVYALDADGNALGGGRWTDGSPFKDKGKLGFVFPLDSSQFHHAFKIVVCHDYDLTPINFTISGLFDQ